MRVLSVKSEKLFFAIRVIVYCLKTIGLAPFSVRIENPSQINPNYFSIEIFSFSNIGLVYNILFLISVTVLSIIYKPNFVHSRNLNGDSIVDILSAILTGEKVLCIFTSCLIILSWAFGQRHAVRVMNRLLQVNVHLSGLKKQSFNKRTLIFLTLHIILNTCLWITVWVMMISYFEVGNRLSEFFNRLPEYIIYWFIIEYVIIVGIVSRDLETVNKYLLNFEHFGNHFYLPPVRNGVHVVSVSNLFSSQIASLKLLRHIRTTLFEVCEGVSDFFSLPILFSIACCFIPIFEKLYQMSRVTNDFSPGETICMILVSVLQYIYPIVSLALNVTQTRKEAESTGQIVHKLLVLARTGEIKAELEQFSLQLLHERVDFTAHGFFTLDSTLLQSMLGGVASYAIILMQFGSSVCNCNCNWNGTSADRKSLKWTKPLILKTAKENENKNINTERTQTQEVIPNSFGFLKHSRNRSKRYLNLETSLFKTLVYG